jgi:hypothetical protein
MDRIVTVIVFMTYDMQPLVIIWNTVALIALFVLKIPTLRQVYKKGV